jgi:hypothetical protein
MTHHFLGVRPPNRALHRPQESLNYANLKCFRVICLTELRGTLQRAARRHGDDA